MQLALRWIVGGALVVAATAWALGPRAASAKDGDALKLPAAVMELARATKAGGEFALELEADGTVLAMEAEIAPEDLPANVVAAAEKAQPGGKIVAAEREWIEGESYWEAVKEIDGVRHELLFKADGTLGGREVALAKDAVPAGIVAAADKAVPGGELVVVEKVDGAEAGKAGSEFHVKKTVSGEVLRISVSPEGKVTRVLRKMKSELKFPK